MPRPPRIHDEGIYHVIARGNRRQAIFHDDDDRRFFITLFGRAVRRHKWRPLGHCLLTNHFHLVVDSPVGTLSRGMHYLNGVYARSFNEEHCVDGHLFEGRFRSRLVETESYLHELYRYLAFNPVRAGLCEHPSDWPWSSFRNLDGSRFVFDR
jgi:REP element-mobilizing transposase RayT